MKTWIVREMILRPANTFIVTADDDVTPDEVTMQTRMKYYYGNIKPAFSSEVNKALSNDKFSILDWTREE